MLPFTDISLALFLENTVLLAILDILLYEGVSCSCNTSEVVLGSGLNVLAIIIFL
jgi:hypothetical protein